MATKETGAQCLVSFPATSVGVWMKGNPFRANLPLLMIQITVVVAMSRLLHLLLKPLKQPAFISQILAGVLLGPTALGKLPFFTNTLYPAKRMTPYNTLSMVSLCMYMFVIGVKTDLSMLRQSGKKAVAIGLVGNATSFTATAMARYYFPIPPPKSLTLGLGLVIAIPATFHPSYFVVITSLLSELRLLNSKVGRLAVSSSLISDLAGEFVLRVIRSVLIGKFTGKVVLGIASFVSFGILIALAFFVARPAVLSILARTPKGELLDETYFVSVIILCLGFGLLSEFTGQTMEVGMFMLGLLLPSGPPLGSTVTEKLEGFMNFLGIPIFFATVGLNSNLFSIDDTASAAYLWGIILICYFSKFLSVLIITVFCSWSVNNAIIVALMMSSRGIFEIRCLIIWLNTKTANLQACSIITSFLILQGMLTSPLIKILYKPWEMYKTDKRRTIQHWKKSTELRVLACVHQQEHVMPIINILSAIHNTNSESMCVYVMHMIQNTGQAGTVLAPYRDRRSFLSIGGGLTKTSEPIVNKFRHFEEKNPQYVSVQPFVSIAPRNTMHDDVCYLSLEKKVNLVVLPFHRTVAIDGSQENTAGVRSMNINVLAYAPCSVGILITHEQDGAMVLASQHNVAVFFFGGADDREAVSLAALMTDNPKLRLSVIRFILPDEWRSDSSAERTLDDEVIADFRANYLSDAGDRVLFRQERISDVEVMMDNMRSMCREFGLIIVGRREGSESILNEGLEMWSEHPELGVMGDILASIDFSRNVSTLVVQQQRMSYSDRVKCEFESGTNTTNSKYNILDP